MKLYLAVLFYMAVIIVGFSAMKGFKHIVLKLDSYISRAVTRWKGDTQWLLDAFVSGQPDIVRAFFEQDFTPANEKELEVFLEVQQAIEEGRTKFDDHHAAFAVIGNGELLSYLYKEHRGCDSPEDNEIRFLVLNNPRCQINLFLTGLTDSYWKARKAAVMNPCCPERFIRGRYGVEKNIAVKNAIEERLKLQDADKV